MIFIGILCGLDGISCLCLIPDSERFEAKATEKKNYTRYIAISAYLSPASTSWICISLVDGFRLKTCRNNGVYTQVATALSSSRTGAWERDITIAYLPDTEA